MIRFIEVINETNFNPRMERTSQPRFRLSEVWINEKYVVSIREARGYQALLREGLLPEGLEEAHAFTAIVSHEGNATQTQVVVGSPSTVAQKLKQDTKTLLKG